MSPEEKMTAVLAVAEFAEDRFVMFATGIANIRKATQ